MRVAIAVTIVIGQIRDLLGLTYPAGTVTIDAIDKMSAAVQSIGTFDWQALLVGVVFLAILIVWPKVSIRIPASPIAVIAGAAMVPAFHLNVNTIGGPARTSRRGIIGSAFSRPFVPDGAHCYRSSGCARAILRKMSASSSGDSRMPETIHSDTTLQIAPAKKYSV